MTRRRKRRPSCRCPCCSLRRAQHTRAPTCFGGQENDWTGGFLLGTILMLALPPMIVVSAGIAIYRATKRQEARLRERDAQRARELVQHGAS